MFKWANQPKIKGSYVSVLSPDEKTELKVCVKNGAITYSVLKDETLIIKPSRLGFLFFGEEPLGRHLEIVKTQRRKRQELIEMSWGEERYINNHYNECAIYLSEAIAQKRIMTIRFRVFDNGVAFRYEIPPQPKFQRLTVKEEQTEFNISERSEVWVIPAYQPDRYEYNYERKKIEELTGSVHTPMTIKTPTGYYLCIHEAALYDYGAMNIKYNSKRGALLSDITPLSDNSKAHLNLPFHTPWRLIMIADSSIALTANRIMYALNEPPKKDFSWVKTLKFIGIWWAMYVGEWTWAPGENHGATTEHAKEYIDAAVRLGITGLLIEGWNEGWEGDWLENGINNSFTDATKDFDMETVSNYAKSRNVELVGHHETVGFVDNYEKQLEASYNYYLKNGIRYIKTGYAGKKMMIRGREEYHHSQLGVNHYQKTVELAAKKHICLDIHEPIKGTGIERTWPNLLTREGARGQEYEGGAISPSHACILPYTRILAGGMDYTSGIFDLNNPKKPIQTTVARQLAYYIVIYSGMQMAADRPEFYENVGYKALFRFIQDVPTTFEKTIPLMGEIGEYYIVARQDSQKTWYIGGVTNENSRTVDLSFYFLDSRNYSAEFYCDGDDADYINNKFSYKIFKKKVNKNTTIKLFIAPGGGFAIKLQPL